MATTDARTGFRLPWSSDQRPQGDEAAKDGVASGAGQPEERMMIEATSAEGATAAGDDGTSGSAGGTGGRRPNKFLADLTKAMQAAAESARGETLSRLQAEGKTHIEEIHGRSATDAADLRRKADDDVAAIRDWSKNEVARIREETDGRIADRKGRLEREIDEHAARIERQIERVQGRMTAFESQMAQFFERLLAEEDPTRFASMAENLPEPPAFDADDSHWSAAYAAAAAAGLQIVPAGPLPTAPPTPAPAEPAAKKPADTEAAMAAIQAAAEAAEVAARAPSGPPAADEQDPRLAALALSPDFAAAEAEAAAAAGRTPDAEEIPTIADDALAARLAGLVPPEAESKPKAGENGSTQVVVGGLVSVASIASFKRHLGRMPGVQSVGVSSGPDGEFIFAVTHSSDVVLREAIPALPGFQARITGGTDGVVQVSARDPESEG